MEKGYLWLNTRTDLAAENVDLLNSVKRIIRKLEKGLLHIIVKSCIPKVIEVQVLPVSPTLAIWDILKEFRQLFSPGNSVPLSCYKLNYRCNPFVRF